MNIMTVVKGGISLLCILFTLVSKSYTQNILVKSTVGQSVGINKQYHPEFLFFDAVNLPQYNIHTVPKSNVGTGFYSTVSIHKQTKETVGIGLQVNAYQSYKTQVVWTTLESSVVKTLKLNVVEVSPTLTATSHIKTVECDLFVGINLLSKSKIEYEYNYTDKNNQYRYVVDFVPNKVVKTEWGITVKKQNKKQSAITMLTTLTVVNMTVKPTHSQVVVAQHNNVNILTHTLPHTVVYTNTQNNVTQNSQIKESLPIHVNTTSVVVAVGIGINVGKL
jgi:hypothetical protein